jgi:hypothetical protein
VEIYGFRLEERAGRFTKCEDLIDDLVPQVDALHRKLAAINLLVGVCDVERPTEKHMVVGRVFTIVQDLVVEQVVASQAILS